MRQVIMSPDEKGFWYAQCPSLPGCATQGATQQEALSNIKEAITLYVEALEEQGLPVPEEKFDSAVLVV